MLPLPSSPLNSTRPAWAPSSSHLAMCSESVQPGSRSCVQLVLRLSDGAHKAHILETAGPRQVPLLDRVELLWAPAAPSGRPRLAVVSGNKACLAAVHTHLPMSVALQQLASPLELEARRSRTI